MDMSAGEIIPTLAHPPRYVLMAGPVMAENLISHGCGTHVLARSLGPTIHMGKNPSDGCIPIWQVPVPMTREG